MRDKLRLLFWALTLHIVPLHAQDEEDHSNDDIQNPNTPITLTTNFHCINIYRIDPTVNPSQSPTKLCPDDPPFSSYNYDIWISCGFPHDGPERTSPTKYLRATWLSHITLSWHSESAILDAKYIIIQTSWLLLSSSSSSSSSESSRSRTVIQRACNPRNEVELNPYWLDFFFPTEKKVVGGDERDSLTWGIGGLEYDKGIRNSVCGKEEDGAFNTDGFTLKRVRA